MKLNFATFDPLKPTLVILVSPRDCVYLKVNIENIEPDVLAAAYSTKHNREIDRIRKQLKRLAEPLGDLVHGYTPGYGSTAVQPWDEFAPTNSKCVLNVNCTVFSAYSATPEARVFVPKGDQDGTEDDRQTF